ncbi:MAG: bifunctional alpha,alpha-trehalose-phosphate synthase (UDP-forming)/trehalose-phosphatase, partial [Bacteroidetes bacterium]|nr:bifunctional alpha,alpha-trehalose-phosphate synthase (UDP-forming)/trehalose-phosphatase [Bacteroidota bacterium]
YRNSLGEIKIILSIDRLDYSKGIPQRLKAFELFLEKYPEFRNNVSFFMIVVPSRDQVGKYKELKEEVDELVGRINGNYGRINWTPIHYFYRSMPLDALSAFYRMANVALVTPMRDGMNLVCKEYIASKLDKKGVLILSEMAGASKELSDAILINPNDINQLVEALYNSLTMPVEEQMQRMEIMQKSLKRYNIHHWVKLFMEELERVKSKQDALTTKILDEVTLKDLGQKFSRARKRLIFLDYDGTLVPFNGDPKMSKPDKELTEILTTLTTNKKNKVVIISGRDRDTLWIWLGKYHLDFICEHGVWLKEFDQDWKTLVTLTDEWKKDINNLLELYVSRTPGSFVEEKDFSLVWHYRKVETGLGELRTRELMSHLKYKVSDSNLRVHEGDKVVEIKSSRVNKGRAALKWLDKDDYDFIMAIGDDLTDEDTFKAMPPENSYTIKVGGKTSAAMFSLRSYQEVRDLLKKLESA